MLTILAMLVVRGQPSRGVTLILITLSIVVSTRYIWWRFSETLQFPSEIEAFLGIGLILAETYAWLVLVLGYIQTAWPLNRPPVGLPEDIADWPTVDLFIPTYNEPLSVVQTTVLGALSIDYPLDKLKIYILDDTDGDMLIAWALARAARRWHSADYRAAAHRIVVDIREKLIARIAGRLVLLPGTDGFTSEDGIVTLNPSYYIYPAFEEFPRLDGSAQWARLRRDGLGLLAKARFGQWELTPDWIAIDQKGGVTPASRLPPRFGFDAIRVPLYLIWGREATTQRLGAVSKFWDGFADKPVPAWVDVTNGSLAPFAAPSGSMR